MSIVFGILEEERQRILAARELYEKRLSEMPKGNLRVRPHGKKRYVYLQFREGLHVRSRYVGEEHSVAVRALSLKLEERKKLQGFLSAMRDDMKIIEKVRRVRARA
jgi:hypothetical protein